MRLIGAREAGLVHVLVRASAAHLLERDARLEPRERLPDADVLAVAEVELALGRAADVEAIGIRELALVAARGARDEPRARPSGS